MRRAAHPSRLLSKRGFAGSLLLRHWEALLFEAAPQGLSCSVRNGVVLYLMVSFWRGVPGAGAGWSGLKSPACSSVSSAGVCCCGSVVELPSWVAGDKLLQEAARWRTYNHKPYASILLLAAAAARMFRTLTAHRQCSASDFEYQWSCAPHMSTGSASAQLRWRLAHMLTQSAVFVPAYKRRLGMLRAPVIVE